MSTPYEFEVLDSDVELGDTFEFEEAETEWNGESGRWRRPVRWSGRPRAVRRRAPPRSFRRSPRAPMSRPRPRLTVRPRPRFPTRSLFPVILPSWGGWLAQPPFAAQGAAEPSAWSQAGPPAAGPSYDGPPADGPSYGGAAAAEPAAMDDQQQPDGSPADTAQPADTAPGGDEPQEESARVRWLQTRLNQVLGLKLPVTGVLDPPTRSATRSFQRKHGLPADGAVSRETAWTINEIAARVGRPASLGVPARPCGCSGASNKRRCSCPQCQQRGSQRNRY
jgi:hypothetical protein